jgi:cation:H+ antiporter
MQSTAVLLTVFVTATVISLGSSGVLILRIERLGSRFGVTEAVLGLVAAVAADAPEITSAITALVRGQNDVGAGVVLGANVFQLAALLGVGALFAGFIRLGRGLVVLEGIPAGWVAIVALGVVTGWVVPVAGLVLALAVFVPYVVLSALSPQARSRLPLPAGLRGDVTDAIEVEEEEDIAAVLRDVHSGKGDIPAAFIALALVVAASVTLEASASEIGARWGVSDVVLGGVILAALTSLPNLVAAVYLAKRGRGAATLSEAMNSNRVNTLVGLLIPAVFLGVAFSSSLRPETTSLAFWYAFMTAFVLTLAFLRRGLGRWSGTAVLVMYVIVVLTLVA